MIKNHTRSSCATMAISAVLALVSTPALAQVADPVVAPATAAPPVAAAPTIVIPEVTPAPAPVALQIAPTPQEVAATPAEPTTTATTRSAVREAAPRVQRSTPRAAPIEAAAPIAALPAAAPVNPIAAPAPVAPEAPVDQPAARPAPAAAAIPADDNTNWLLPVGALALLGIGGIAVAASRRRRSPYDLAADNVVYDGAPNAGMTKADTPDTALEPVATPVVTPPAGTRFANLSPAASTKDGPVPTGEEREAVLERMVAAAPDEANPFKSPQGRRRRARLILQARENHWAERAVEAPAPAPAFTRRAEPSPVRAPEPEFA